MRSNPRLAKIIRELLTQKRRFALVVLSMAIGVFAVGTILASASHLLGPLADNYAKANPAQAIFTTEPFGPDLLASIEEHPQAIRADARYVTRIRARQGQGEWFSLELYALDFARLGVNLYQQREGTWPPGPGQILMEQSTLGFGGIALGDSLELDVSSERHTLTATGVVRDMHVPPAALAGRGYGYVSMETLASLGLGSEFNQLYLVTNAAEREGIGRAAAIIRDQVVEPQGVRVHRIKIPEPGKHLLQDILVVVTGVLGFMGFAAIVVSAFLVVNTMHAFVARQIRQIGVMKALGANLGQVVSIYLGLAGITGIVALVPALPLSWWGARAFTSLVADLLNLDASNLRFPLWVTLLQLFLGLATPLAASLLPVLKGSRVTVRQAITDYGIPQGSRIAPTSPAWLSRPLKLSIRSTLKARGRLTLTLLTLVLSGAMFISVFSVRTGLGRAMEELGNYWHYDIEANFSVPYPVTEVEERVTALPGVVRVESWLMRDVFYLRPDGSENENLFVIAVAEDSQMIKPTVIKGRWLAPGDADKIVVNTDLLHEEPGLTVGDKLNLRVLGKVETWEIVGLVTGQISGPVAYVGYSHFTFLTDSQGQANRLVLQTESGRQEEVAQALARHLEGMDVVIGEVQTREDILERLAFWFRVPVLLLLVMSLLLALVGGFGLMGALGLGVMERTREIGVLRAIGAPTPAILQIFTTEGLVIAALSWPPAIICSIPLSLVLNRIIGLGLIKLPLAWVFPWGGALLWLLLSLFLAGAVSLLPARQACNISVGEAISYE